jgi:hypothetical protein
MGVNFSEFKGLIPGTISDLNVLNPYSIMTSFLSGSNPKCQQITMQTIDTNNNVSNETHYVTTVDIQNMDPCSFSNKKNPITGASCKEAFVPEQTGITIPKDTITQLYFASLSALIIYLIFKIMTKKK